MNTTDLRRLALAATPGPWRVILPGDVEWAERRKYRCVAFDPKDDAGYTTAPLLPADARLIAAASPAVVLALLDVVDAAQDTVSDIDGVYALDHALAALDRATEGEK